MKVGIVLRSSAGAGFFLWIFLSTWISPMALAASPPTDATGRCNVILAYEGLCGNSRTGACIGREGVDYWHNASHQQTWDNFYNLCVNVTPYKDRYSHECIELYGLASTCHSTVEPLVEYVAATQFQAEYQPIQSGPQYVANTQINYEAQICGLMSAQGQKIDAYKAACGEVSPSQCSADGVVESDYIPICADKKPCQCRNDYNCGPACPVEAPEPGAGGGEGPGGGSGGGAPPEAGTAGGPPPGSSIALGAEDAKNPSSGEAQAGGAGAKGCSLSTAGGGSPSFLSILWLGSLIIGSLNLRLRGRR